MARNHKNPYRRLPGLGRGWMGISRLYLGTDHLLKVDSGFCTEAYRRFYFHDIQAIYLARTSRRQAINASLLAILLLWAALLLWIDGFSGVSGFLTSIPLLSVSGCLLVGMAINTLMGPTCRTELLTAVSRVPLPSLHRIRTARKALGRLGPLVEAAQGGVDPSALENALAEIRGQLTTTPVPSGAASRGERLGSLACFLLLIATGTLGLLHCWVNGMATFTLMNLAMLGALGSAIVTLVLVYYRNGARPLLSWAALGYSCIHALAVYAGMIAFGAMKQPERMNDHLGLLRGLAAIPVRDSLPIFTIYLVLAVAALAIGLAGLLLSARSRLVGKS